MNRLFLASNVNKVAKDLAKYLLPKKKKVLFIITASEVYGENPEWLEEDRKALKNVGFMLTDYTITDKKASDLGIELKSQDILIISGGNSYYLLEKIQQSDTAKIIKNALVNGMPYIGSSAGSVIAGPSIKPVGKLDDISKAPQLEGFEALGLVDFVAYPHWGYKKYLIESMVNIKENYTENYKFILLTDYQYVRVEGEMYKIEVVNS